jgi:3-hydroxybutyrate dehydrogenase
MTSWLDGKTALVTGGGRGIGRAIARSLAAAGAHVVVVGRTMAELELVAHEAGGTALAVDLSSRASVDALLAELAARSLSVEALVANAGTAESAPLAKTSDELWDRTLELNVTSVFRLARALVPPMVARGRGRVVMVASNAGLTGYAYTSAYVASKHALVGLTRALAQEVAKSGVTVNAVCPGFVRTAMTERSIERIADKTGRSRDEAERSLAALSPQARLIEPEEVAAVVAMLCTEEARGIHGQALAIDGGQVMH